MNYLRQLEAPVVSGLLVNEKFIKHEEKTKFKVQIPHDGRPETNTYPMILDATGSFDPDQGDRIRFSWKQ